MKNFLYSLIMISVMFVSFYTSTHEVHADITTDLVGWWKFDEGTGTSAADSSGSGYNGTLTNGTTWGAAQIGAYSSVFDGTNDYVALGSNLSFERTDPFTISAWIYRTGGDVSSAIIGKYNSASNYEGYTFHVIDSAGADWVSGPNSLVIDLISNYFTNNRLVCRTPANSISMNTWHHVTVSYAGGSNASSVKFYIDNVAQTVTCAATTLSASIVNSVNPRIGDNYDDDYFEGSIDELRVYSRVLTAGDVSELYAYTGAANGYGVMSSGSYSITSDSINFGGGRSISDSYRLEDTAGEIATGDSASDSFVLRAGYQQMGAVSISATPASDVVMSPALGGLTGGTSDGSTSFEVSTDNPAGYSVTIVASGTPALQSADDSFADYVPAGAAPDFTFTNAASASSFAFSPEGNDIIQRYMDDGASCNTGSGDAETSCWDGLSTTPKTIVSRMSANHPAGTQTTVRFRAAIGSSRVQTNGTYVATTTVTILPL